MPYTTEDGGRLNNFAQEPRMYKAAPPTKTQQRSYILWGIAATILLSGVIFVAFSVSNMS